MTFALLALLAGPVLAEDGGTEDSADPAQEPAEQPALDPDAGLPSARGEGEDPLLDEADLAPLDEQVEPERIFDPPDMEIVVTDEYAVQRARQELDTQLTDMGYEVKKRRNGRTIYQHETSWRQRVVVDDDGWIYFRKRPPHVTVPATRWQGVPVVEWMPCALLPTACLRRGSWMVNPKLLEQDRSRTVVASEDEVRGYADAIAGKALTDKLYQELPATLDAIWYSGQVPGTELVLEQPVQRRMAILELWLSRTDNAYGDAVRQVIETYMAYEIQPSDHPYSAEELEWANRVRTNERVLELPSTTWDPADLGDDPPADEIGPGSPP